MKNSLILCCTLMMSLTQLWSEEGVKKEMAAILENMARSCQEVSGGDQDEIFSDKFELLKAAVADNIPESIAILTTDFSRTKESYWIQLAISHSIRHVYLASQDDDKFVVWKSGDHTGEIVTWWNEMDPTLLQEFNVGKIKKLPDFMKSGKDKEEAIRKLSEQVGTDGQVQENP